MTNTAENEWKRIQIDLTKLQTDIQISLAIGLALFAGAGGFLIAQQQFIGLTHEIFYWMTFVSAILAIITLIPVALFRKRMNTIKV